MFAKKWSAGRAMRRALLVCFSAAVPTLGVAATAYVAGDAAPFQRIMPSAGALLVMVQNGPPPPAACAAAKTQGEMTQCAYDDFLEASAAYAASHAALAKRQTSGQRAKWLRTQSAWLKYRTAACDFESSALDGGSLKPFVNWRCAARLTRERAAEVARMGTCREGDAACVGPRQ